VTGAAAEFDDVAAVIVPVPGVPVALRPLSTTSPLTSVGRAREPASPLDHVRPAGRVTVTGVLEGGGVVPSVVALITTSFSVPHAATE
jgi:hypothetical protein